VIRLQTALGEQLFDIAQRERIPKIPTHGTKNQLRRRLPPLEDCRSGCVLHGLFRLPTTPAKVATHPAKVDIEFFAGTAVKSNFLINIGYGDPAKLFPRSPRLSFDEIARIV
jgi:hypothetical protein